MDRFAEWAAAVLLFWLAAVASLLLTAFMWRSAVPPKDRGSDDAVNAILFGICVVLLCPAIIALDLRRLRGTFGRIFVTTIVTVGALVPSIGFLVLLVIIRWRS